MTFFIPELDWKDEVVKHIWENHKVEPYEAEEARSNAKIYRDAKYRRKMIVGPTAADRWLTVIIETDGAVVTAFDADDKVRKL